MQVPIRSLSPHSHNPCTESRYFLPSPPAQLAARIPILRRRPLTRPSTIFANSSNGRRLTHEDLRTRKSPSYQIIKHRVPPLKCSDGVRFRHRYSKHQGPVYLPIDHTYHRQQAQIIAYRLPANKVVSSFCLSIIALRGRLCIDR